MRRPVRPARPVVGLVLALACGAPAAESPVADRAAPAGAASVITARDLVDSVPEVAPVFEPAAAPDLAPTGPTTEFGRLIVRLSEPGGFFPSDNLVSNETSYLHVLGRMRSMGVRGGAYVGVGPDQNFSYIAHVRPEIAFIIDIRRDNLLHHLLFKALFEQARSRVEFLALMLGRPVPAGADRWDEATIDEIVVYIDTAQASPERFEEVSERIRESVQRFGYPLSEADLGTIRGIHSIFFELGLDIRYSMGGQMRYGRFPSWRLLMLETDLQGRRRSYLASEESFRYVKTMQRRNRIVPVVGDLAGPHALAAIGREIAGRGLTISAFYVSNVEQYLMRGSEFARYAASVASLPFDDRSVLIRSYFARGRPPLPQTVPGHFSTQLLERFETFVGETRAGGYRSYLDLVTRNAIPLEPDAHAA